MTDNKIYNVFINSANRGINETPYDFTIFFDSDEIIIYPDEGVNVNVVSFSMLNSMYNVNQYTKNNQFKLKHQNHTELNVTIPFGNYSVYTLRDELNKQMTGKISVSYNVATNTYTYTNLTQDNYKIIPMNCNKLLGLNDTTDISTYGTTSDYINMVNYQQIILRCPTLIFESYSVDNIQDKNNFLAVSDFLYWINKQDIEPFKTINYKNEDCSTAYSYNVLNTHFNSLNFKLVNEYNEPILDAPDFLLQLQISVFRRDAHFYKVHITKILNVLDDLYYTVLNILNFIIRFRKK